MIMLPPLGGVIGAADGAEPEQVAEAETETEAEKEVELEIGNGIGIRKHRFLHGEIETQS